MDLIERLLCKDRLELQAVIHGLSFFLTATNHAFKYNESYLNNYSECFINFLDLFRGRRKFAQQLATILAGEIIKVTSFTVFVDNIWQIDYPSRSLNYKEEGDLNYLSKKKIIIETISESEGHFKRDVHEFKSGIDVLNVVDKIIAPYPRVVDDKNVQKLHII